MLFDELKKRREEILAIARQCGLTNIKVFGSVARGEERPDSDIDFLVSKIPNVKTTWGYIGFKADVEELLGRKVDVAIDTHVYPLMREGVFQDAKPL